MINLLIALFISVSFSEEKDAVLPKLNKVPKSVYLIKKARVDSDVGEPILYSDEQQMRMLYNDTFYKRNRLPSEDTSIKK